jgi:hypothetical protein
MTESDMSQPLAGKSPATLATVAGRARPRRRLFTSERGLGLAGLALAVASGSFAAYMIRDNGRQPHFSGAEYLTVFAKLTPSGRPSPDGWARPDLPTADPAEADDLATASIPRKIVPGADEGSDAPAPSRLNPGAFAPGATLREYVLRSVTKGVALIESPEGLREVRVGTILPYAGLVTSIERRDGKWVIITSRGLIREARK